MTIKSISLQLAVQHWTVIKELQKFYFPLFHLWNMIWQNVKLVCDRKVLFRISIIWQIWAHSNFGSACKAAKNAPKKLLAPSSFYTICISKRLNLVFWVVRYQWGHLDFHIWYIFSDGLRWSIENSYFETMVYVSQLKVPILKQWFALVNLFL